MQGREPLFVPCTPLGCIALLDRCNIPIKGKNAVVVSGRRMAAAMGFDAWPIGMRVDVAAGAKPNAITLNGVPNFAAAGTMFLASFMLQP
jgi:hypothetical protein